MVTLKELADKYKVSERKARKLLRQDQATKDTNYFWKWIADSTTLTTAETILSTEYKQAR